MPKEKIERWKEDREIWLKHHPQLWNETTQAEYHKRFSPQINKWLDQGSGSCLLRDPKNAKIVAEALREGEVRARVIRLKPCRLGRPRYNQLEDKLIRCPPHISQKFST